jgi:hypothetical protein
MGTRRRYRKKTDQCVVAVQLKLDTNGFIYRKWGDEQRCKAGDWIVDSGGDIYTIDEEVFAATYRPAGTGTYIKTTSIWAERASAAGSVVTKEGRTHYEQGDYLVSNNEDGTDDYAIEAEKFESMYELDT